MEGNSQWNPTRKPCQPLNLSKHCTRHGVGWLHKYCCLLHRCQWKGCSREMFGSRLMLLAGRHSDNIHCFPRNIHTVKEKLTPKGWLKNTAFCFLRQLVCSVKKRKTIYVVFPTSRMLNAEDIQLSISELERMRTPSTWLLFKPESLLQHSCSIGIQALTWFGMWDQYFPARSFGTTLRLLSSS